MKNNNYVDRFEKKVIRFSVKEKLAIAAGVVFFILIYFMFFNVDKTPYGYASIPDNVFDYLKSSGSYSDALTSGKLVVLHCNKTDKRCTYNSTFQSALERAAENDAYKDKYEFVNLYLLKNTMLADSEGQEIIKQEKALRKVCRKFCVVNPSKKELYFYFEPKARDAMYLEDNLKALQNWGAKLN